MDGEMACIDGYMSTHIWDQSRSTGSEPLLSTHAHPRYAAHCAEKFPPLLKRRWSVRVYGWVGREATKRARILSKYYENNLILNHLSSA